MDTRSLEHPTLQKVSTGTGQDHDGLSFVSFRDQEVLSLTGGSIAFHFGAPQSDGSVPFTIAPSDVSMPEISLPGGQTMTYGLASSASGQLSPSTNGTLVHFSATVAATVSGSEEEGGTLTYAVPFTTETVSTTSGGQTLEVTGARIVSGARYTQLVGATVDKPGSVIDPGAPVYTVLSGTFDQLP
jgi:hypothetical protein